MLGLTLGLLLAVVVGAATAILLANGTDRFKIQGGHLYERNRIADCASMYPDDTAKSEACIANLP